MARKTTPWVDIKAEYLQGVTPKDLAKKYKVSDKTVREKASREGWVRAKTMIYNNLQYTVQEKIKDLTNNAIEVLCSIMNSVSARDTDKVSACKAILDISGLKSSKQEITGKDGEPIGIQKVYITPEEKAATDSHIDGVIDG